MVFIGLLLAGICNALHAQVDNTKLSVYIFLSPECPLSQNYTKTLNGLNDEYGNHVRFIGVIPGRTYSPAEIKKYVSEYKVRFKIIRDKKRALVSKMNATVTPEVILVNEQKAVLYQGAIDDWAISLGKKKLSPTTPYLKNAIEQALHGKEIVVRSTKPVGCLIDDY